MQVHRGVPGNVLVLLVWKVEDGGWSGLGVRTAPASGLSDGSRRRQWTTNPGTLQMTSETASARGEVTAEIGKTLANFSSLIKLINPQWLNAQPALVRSKTDCASEHTAMWPSWTTVYVQVAVKP